ncbi:MAG TPA: GNAT family N-acetyltransferase [Streptosporangiaceae bacterium]|nr:GNAT family N-acetyltransferase [Streptosporangiaceae bacterium]
MSEPVIRRAGDADVPALAALRREWTREWGGAGDEPGFGERFAAWFEQEAGRRVSWLAEADGDAVGMVNLAVFERMPQPGRAPSRWGYLANAFVLPAYRDRGVGGRLLDALLSYADEHNFARVVLSPSERAIPLYERAGFAPARELLIRTPPSDRHAAEAG